MAHKSKILIIGGTGYIGKYIEESAKTRHPIFAVMALGIFLRVFLKKHKLHNLIKIEIHILKTTTIKKHA